MPGPNIESRERQVPCLWAPCTHFGSARSGPPGQTSCASYDPAAFHAGDVTLGAWRRTVTFLERSTPRPWERGSSSGSLTSCTTATPASSFSDRSNAEGLASCGRSGEQTPSLSGRSPTLHSWLMPRIGTRARVCLVAFFVAFEALRFMMAENLHTEGVNTFSVAVVAHLCSMAIALTLSFLLEGQPATKKVFSWHPLWRFIWVAVMFTCASALTLLARQMGTTAAQVETLGYVYMPISAVLSYYVFQREYGKLEWLALGMITLAIVTFVLLREQYKGLTLIDNERTQLRYTVTGFVFVLLAVVLSVSASILAERIFKDRSRGLRWWSADFYVMKVHIDFSSLLLSACMWLLPSYFPRFLGPLGSFLEQGTAAGTWFGAWSWKQGLVIFVTVGQGWSAGLLVKEFSTVTRAVVTTLTLVLVMCVEDPLMGNRFNFHAREVPSVLLAIIVFLSGMIFQTGRINLRQIQNAAKLGPGPQPLAQPQGTASPNNTATRLAVDEECGAEDAVELHTSEAIGPGGMAMEKTALERRTVLGTLTTYALVIVYILADTLRNVTLQTALSSTVINSNSMSLMQYACGVFVASFLSFSTHGFTGLRRAWEIRKIIKCLPAGFLFALSTALMNMAYSRGMTAALALVLGKFYILVAAVGARCVLGKFYMWLEYVAIGILTLASATFGYLQAIDVETGTASMFSVVSMLAVLGSAATAAFNSLLTERILKGEDVAFHVQKVRLDAASTLSTLALIPTMGLIIARAQDVPWVVRPVSGTCPQSSVCWDPGSGACASASCTCECAKGLFAGWMASSQAVILLALAMNTVHGWLVGKLVHNFSTVHRAVADSFSLLLIYFVAEPVLNGARLDNMCLNLVAFVVPLSSALFTVAAGEMQKVMQSVAAPGGGSETVVDSDGTREPSRTPTTVMPVAAELAVPTRGSEATAACQGAGSALGGTAGPVASPVTPAAVS
mmetsp:Transcript_102420/g.330380  ORF Transcript_102420/g.330380 Transcript_102420/m.330380 type:complete len:959 (-) Transcript_102420:96-2972(-)